MFEDSVADFDLSVGSRMLEFGESVFNIMLLAHRFGLRCSANSS
ncbi:hypothetical protein [Holospora obtusa]|nr:hypothetical protein [Holospora obtusa]